MSPLLTAFLTGLAATLVAFTLVWLLSIRLRDVSIVDICWGLGFVLCAWVYRLLGPEASPRQWLVLGLVTLWGVRLAAYIAWRHNGEDYRYQAMRKRAGESFVYKSWLRVFMLQGVLVSLIALPHLFLQAQSDTAPWGWSDWLGLSLFAVGFFFEAVGDWQLAAFKGNPENRGKVLRSGLWGITRHPNYFGDATLWWGFFFFALAFPGGLYTLPSVLLMTFFLLKVSGVSLLEKTITERRPEYARYKREVPAFIPWFPKRSAGTNA